MHHTPLGDVAPHAPKVSEMFRVLGITVSGVRYNEIYALFNVATVQEASYQYGIRLLVDILLKARNRYFSMYLA